MNEKFPSPVVTPLGNSERIAKKHFRRVFHSHLAGEVERSPKSARNPTRAVLETTRNNAHAEQRNEKPLVSKGSHVRQDWAILDLNPSECHGGNERFPESGAESGAVGARDTLVDADLDRLIELWPTLVSDDRAALLAHAEHLAALRDAPDAG